MADWSLDDARKNLDNEICNLYARFIQTDAYSNDAALGRALHAIMMMVSFLDKRLEQLEPPQKSEG